MSSDEVIQQLRVFARKRNWEQFHTPENLAKSVSIEAGELLECFQWGEDSDLENAKHELADVLTYCYFLADKMGVSPEEIILEKLAVTGEKYPVEKSFGRSDRYDRL